MLSLLRRLGFGRTAATASLPAMEERLFECLCPGQGQYTPEKAAQLAGRLREVAASLEPAPPAAAAVAPAAVPGPQQGSNRSEEPDSKRRRKELRKDLTGRGKELDFSAYQQRYVALELLYLGHAYDGFARQETTDETIEGHLFAALRTTRLVPAEASWQELHYSRGGRTDKGVSALGQVVALLLRSAGRAGQPGAQPAEAELDYPALLNRVLPRDIRVLGWADVQEDFSARFSAQYREYKYLIAYLPPSAVAATAAAAVTNASVPALPAAPCRGEAAGGNGIEPPPAAAMGAADATQRDIVPPPGAMLDVGRMREAAAAFLGEHDFRNFCKVDVAQVQNFRRTILDFRVEEFPGCAWGGRKLLQLHIRGTAFLWHQVRCMAAVLLMVGRGAEEPGIVARLLDTAATPRKPQYNMASEEPLLLHSCTYAGLSFHRSQQNYALVRGQLEDMLSSHMIRAGTLHTIQQRLGADDLPAAEDPGRGGGSGGSSSSKRQRGNVGSAGGSGPKHIPLLLRAKEPAVEERLLKLAASRGPAAAVADAAGRRQAGVAAGAGAVADT